MAKQHATSNGRYSDFVSAGIGLVSATLISFMLSTVLTSIIIKGTVNEGIIDIAMFIIRMISAFTGCMIGMGFAKEKPLKLMVAILGGYLLIILGLGIVLYDGTFKNLGLGFISVIIGGLLALLIKLKSQRKRKIRSRHIR